MSDFTRTEKPPNADMTQQFYAVKQNQRVQSKVEQLDAIFGDSKHADWWKAFKAGPIQYWLAYYFSNDEKGLWEAVHSKISDLLKDGTTASTARLVQIRKRLTELENELENTRREKEMQEANNANLKSLRAKTFQRANPFMTQKLE